MQVIKGMRVLIITSKTKAIKLLIGLPDLIDVKVVEQIYIRFRFRYKLCKTIFPILTNFNRSIL